MLLRCVTSEIYHVRPILIGFICLLFAAAPAAAEFNAKDKKAIEDVVRQYLLDHPEVILDAIDKLREQERLAKEEAHKKALKDSHAQIYDQKLSPKTGGPDADVTIVEFFDYQCGYCKHVFPTLMKIIGEDKKIQVIWKDLPILSPVSRFAARAAMAADRQGRYFDAHVALMGLKGRLTENRVMDTMEKTGVDMKKLVKDMADPEIERYLDETNELARALGISGTPAFLIGGTLVPGAIGGDDMRTLIAQARDKPKG